MLAGRRLALIGAAVVAAIAACGGGEQIATDTGTSKAAPPMPGQPAPTPATTPATGAQLNPVPGGKVVAVEMVTDAQGNNRFVPNRLEAHEGDVLRFTLTSGVHNVHFLADSNPGVQGLPPAGPLLQLPGQTFDIAVTFKPGHYYFQCDPHALLGMTGRLEVEPKSQ
jgi:plastocyanin